MADKTVAVRLVAVTGPYNKGMADASRATGKLGQDIDQADTKAKGLEGTGKRAAGALKGMAVAAGAVAGTALVAFLTDSVNAAGDLEQSVGGVNAVFGDSADLIHAFGENSAEAVGLSTNAFNELVTVTGAMLKNKGIEDFAQKSLDLVKIGADLSATFGGSAKEAVEALNAAMRGESDPIERYGISLNEAAVNAELAAQGLDGLEGSALEAAKAQARIDIIMRQSADAAGAFAREANTLQGQQQRLNAEWENAKAELGQALLPAMTDFVGLLRQGVDIGLALVDAFEKIPGPIKAAAAALAAFHLAGGARRAGAFSAGTVSIVRSLGEAISYAGDAAKRAGGGFAGLKAGVSTFTGGMSLAGTAAKGAKAAGGALLGLLGGPWGIALTGATLAVTGWMQAQENARKAAEELTSTLDEQTGAFTDSSRQFIMDAFSFDVSAEDLAALRDYGVNLQEAVDVALEGGPAMEAYQAKLRELAQDHPQVASAARGLASSIENQNEVVQDSVLRWENQQAMLGETGSSMLDLKGKVGDVAGALVEAAQSAETVEEPLQTMEEAAKEAAEAQERLTEALVGMVDAAFGAQDAAINYEASLDALTEAIKENGETHDITTEKGRANQKALLDVAQAARDSATANLENGDSLFQVQKDMESARAAFVRGAEQMGYTTAEANELADQLGLTDEGVRDLSASIRNVPSKTVRVGVTGTDEAKRNVESVQSAISRVRGKTVTVNVVTNWSERGRRPGRFLNDVGVATGGYMADVIGLAGGGWPRAHGLVQGRGGPTDDLVPARLSNKEFVHRAAAVDKYGVDAMYAINSGAVDRAVLRSVLGLGLANGGTPWSPAMPSRATTTAAPMVNVSGVSASEIAQAFKQAGLKVEMDGREMGRVVGAGNVTTVGGRRG